MLTYKYYKFPNKQAVPSLKSWPNNVSIHHVGKLSNEDGVYDSLGREIQPPTYKEGWHVNVCYQGNANLNFVQQYEINVNNPKHTWYGQ
jgi:hypothetical protein